MNGTLGFALDPLALLLSLTAALAVVKASHVMSPDGSYVLVSVSAIAATELHRAFT